MMIWLQWIGISFGVLEVLLARANKIALYPAGILSAAITIYLFWHSKLYAESMLNFYYVVISIYGWWNWMKKKNTSPVKISWSKKHELFIAVSISIIGYILLYFILNRYTDSDVPQWDAWVTATAWAGTWLLARRKIENWIFLNISNAFAIPLLFHKQLPLYAFLTIFLFIVAVQGFFSWKKKLKYATI